MNANNGPCKFREGQDTSPEIPDIVNNFVPILGPLHVSLNMKEHIILVHWSFLKKCLNKFLDKTKY
ncbi:6131_t:CDS:2 [Entrophospora sp. SA101]|nr:6131_t:CDS:2 [Entrophospora sp. SA101]